MSTPPKLHVYQTVQQPVPLSQGASMAFQAIALDTLGVFDTAAGKNTRYYPTVPGYYRCFGQGSLNPNNFQGDRTAIFRKNGAEFSTAPAAGFPANNTNGTAGTVVASGIFAMNGINDYIEFFVNQHGTGGPLDTFVNPPSWHTFMIIDWFAPI